MAATKCERGSPRTGGCGRYQSTLPQRAAGLPFYLLTERDDAQILSDLQDAVAVGISADAGLRLGELLDHMDSVRPEL